MGKSGRHQSWNSDQGAVSEVVGSALLVGLTVVAVSVFGFAATQAFSPIKKMNADLSPGLSAGPNGVWGGATGDDVIELRHLGGAALARDATKIVITYTPPAGLPATTTYEKAALGAVFNGNGFSIGESWTQVGSLASCATVQVQVVLQHGSQGTQLLLSETLVANEGVCP